MKLYKDIAGEQVEIEIPLCQQKDGSSGLFHKKLRSFIDAIINESEPPVPSSQILYNQAIIDGIVKSSNLGREIEITIPDIN